MKRTKMIALILSTAIMLTIFAMPASAKANDTMEKISVEDVSPAVLSCLDKCKVSYNQDSVIQVVKAKSSEDFCTDATGLCIRTQNGNQVEYTSLLSFSQGENGKTVSDNLGKILLQSNGDTV